MVSISDLGERPVRSETGGVHEGGSEQTLPLPSLEVLQAASLIQNRRVHKDISAIRKACGLEEVKRSSSNEVLI